MAQVIADRRDLDFVLFEQLKVDELTQHEKFKDFNRKAFDMIISEARNFAVKEVLPTCAEGDRQGAAFENGKGYIPLPLLFRLHVDYLSILVLHPEW